MTKKIRIIIATLIFFLAISSFVFFLFFKKKESQFVIVIPSYNNKEWYKYNINSVLSQTYKNYRVIYIDDCSSDGTYELVTNYLAALNCKKKFQVTTNLVRQGALANHYKAIHMCKDYEIIVCLDGDDWFAHDDVLKILAETYKDKYIWLTYSEFINWPTYEKGWSEPYSEKIISTSEFRKYGFLCPQLRTYYAWLAKKIKKEDLLSSSGDFFETAGDVALMFPMLEMACMHIKFIPEVLCVRNVATPINDFKVNPDLQLHTTEYLRLQQPYLPL